MALIEVQETFGSLLRDKSHWEFELFVGLIETIFIDFIIGFIIWGSIIKPYLKRKKKDIIKGEHELHGITEEHE